MELPALEPAPPPRRTEPPTPFVGARRPISLLLGGLWMAGICVALFFLPILNGLVAGLVVGYRLGDVGRAVGVAVIASLVGAGIGYALFGVMAMPVLGLALGLPLFALTIMSTLVGAGIGGVLAEQDTPRWPERWRE